MGTVVFACHDLTRAPLGVLLAFQVVSLPESSFLVVVIWSNDSLKAIHVTTLGLSPIGKHTVLRLVDPPVGAINTTSWWYSTILSTIHQKYVGTIESFVRTKISLKRRCTLNNERTE